MKMEQTECSEIFAYKIQTSGNYPEESIQVIYIVEWCGIAVQHLRDFAMHKRMMYWEALMFSSVSPLPPPSKTTSVWRTVGVVKHKCITGSYSLFLLNMTSWCRWLKCKVDCVWNVMAHAQKLDFVFRRNGWVHLNRWGRQFSRLLAAEVCT
jgi:hypothetical protein